MGKTTRRLFLGTGISAATIAGVSLLACGRRDETVAFERLDVLLVDMPDPVKVGLACRSEYKLSQLLQEAENTSHITSAVQISCSATRKNALKSHIRSEFAARNLVVCERFVLARTEFLVAGLRLESALSIRSFS